MAKKKIAPAPTDVTIATVAPIKDTGDRRQEIILAAGALQSAIFNSANFSLIATDASGVVQLFNVGAERMLGYTAAEVMDKITPAEISDPQEVIERAKALSVERGTPITPGFEALVYKASRGIEDIYELTYIRKDGSRFPAVVSVTALRDAAGAIIGYLLIGTDNTARKQVEEERMKLDQRLRDQQFYTRSLIESNIDALMTTDTQGIISDLNKQMEALTGCTRDELIGAPFKNYFTDPQRAEASIKQVLAEGKVTNHDLTARSRDGKETAVSFNATTFYDRDRRLQGVCAAARDVTESRRLDQVLREKNVELQTATVLAESANSSKSDFLAMMSHEIRTPMNGVLGMLELLSLTALDRAQQTMLDVVRESGATLQRIIDDILDFSKIEAGKLEVHPAPASVAAVIEAVHAIYAPIGSSKGVMLRCYADPEISPALRFDPMRLRQILNNLVSNALKFTIKGEISVEATLIERSDGFERVRFSVKDTGVGVSPEDQARLFQPFSQAASDGSPRAGGTGLGLAICRRLAMLMAGTVEMESTAGVGTTMTVELALPIADAAAMVSPTTISRGDVLGATVKARRLAPSIGHAESDGTLVLVVDDHPTNRSLLVRQVNTLGYAAESAADGVEALVHWMSGRYGIVVTDCNMPGMNGYELARKIREVESGREGKRTAIIACTANALRGEAEICLAAGMDAYLVKPIDLTELARTLDRWLPLPKTVAPLDRTVLVAISGGKVAIETEILSDFRRVNDDDAVVLRLAVERHDMVQMTSASHRIKGASRAVGAEPLAAVCERLERASQADDWDTIEAHMGLFDLELERLNSYCNDAAAPSPS